MSSSFARTQHPIDNEVDISSVAFWSRPFEERDRSFAKLRVSAPVSWHPPLETHHLAARFRQAGFWAVVRAHDIEAVSRDSGRFSSSVGQVSVRPTPFRLGQTMLVTDPPEHTRYRGALTSAFSPAALRRLRPQIDRVVRQVVLRAAVHREFDLVPAIAAQVPARVLALLLGVPPVEVEGFVAATDAYAGGGVPSRLPPGQTLEAWFGEQAMFLTALFEELREFRRTHPADDLVSLLVHDPQLPPESVLSTLLLLVVAGHDTMKQLVTLSALALHDHPDQSRWLLDDFDSRFDSSFDELVRFASPILSFARTATADVTLEGAAIAAGDKVALFYCSGNRDESAFPRAAELVLDRRVNRHVAFGGGGIHFCLGAALARLQLRAVLTALAPRLPTYDLGEPVFEFNDSVRRVESLPVRRRS